MWPTLRSCSGITLASVERLFSTSIRGCLLKVRVARCPDLIPGEVPHPWYIYQKHDRELAAMHERVCAQRGSRDTPVLVKPQVYDTT
jgi:hypothetical protein